MVKIVENAKCRTVGLIFPKKAKGKGKESDAPTVDQSPTESTEETTEEE